MIARLFITFIWLWTVPAEQAPANLVGKRFPATVVSVSDGDTFDVLLGDRRTLRIRLHGVDSPERGEPFSQQARNFTRVLLFDQRVDVSGRDVDRYGRLVARVMVKGVDASVAIVRAGLACHFTQYSDDKDLADGEASAKTDKRGFWSANAQRPACAVRETGGVASKFPGAAFIGNVNSRLFHAPSCRNALCANCTRPFASRADAERAGFRAAGDCLR